MCATCFIYHWQSGHTEVGEEQLSYLESSIQGAPAAHLIKVDTAAPPDKIPKSADKPTLMPNPEYDALAF